MSNAFFGVIIEESLKKKDVLNKVDILKTEVISVTKKHKTPWVKKWTMYHVKINEETAQKIANEIMNSLDKEHEWYADFKNENNHYIIFKNKLFFINRTKKEEYDKAKKYGISLGIPEYQVDFSEFVK